MRFDPLAALEGSFRGLPFKVAGDQRRGGQRGPVHEYPDRDEPYFEGLGRNAKRFDLKIYFVGSTADLLAERFEAMLWKGEVGTLVLPGLVREKVVGQTWVIGREVGKANWVEAQVSFVEAGRNHWPAPQTSWPHRLLDAALGARTAFAAALAEGLSLVDANGLGLVQEVTEALAGSIAVLRNVLGVAALVAGGNAPSRALSAAGEVTGVYADEFGAGLDAAAFAGSTVRLLGDWADALAGPVPDRAARARAIDALWTIYGEAASDYWYAPAAHTSLELTIVSNQAALSAGLRRGALAEIARLTAGLGFASYDDAVALRSRLADAFDDELDAATDAPGAASALQDLRAASLQAISAAGADKARLVPYIVARPRPALVMAQLFYAGEPDLAGRATELRQRTAAIHPAFLPATGERLSH